MKLTRKVLYRAAKHATFELPARNLYLASCMIDFMREHNGIGLAAPQIGLGRRLFVMEIDNMTWHFFNPEITEYSQITEDFNEACLSFPGDRCIITRPRDILVKFQDHQGSWHEQTFSGIASRCFQHELDHLDGITMWDRQKEKHAEQS
jgi:peptide deformylase